MEPIRVLHVLGGLNRGGAETMVMNLYRIIDKEKVQFDFVIHKENENEYVDEIKSLGGKVYVFPRFVMKNLFLYRKYWMTFLKKHPEYKILHSHVRSYAIVYIKLAKKRKIKTIIHSHSTSNGKGISAYVKWVLQLPLRKKCNYLFACSNVSGEWLFGKKAVKLPNYRLIKNAIDISKYGIDSSVREEYRKKFDAENKYIYGHVGRLSEPKNHRFLLETFSEILKRNPQALLLLVGEGEYRSRIESWIHELNLDKNVIMTGSRQDIPQLLNAMDVFLFPSLWEGLPITVIEAQAVGLPCIISDQITSEVVISEAVTCLPINKGYECWVEQSLSSVGRKFNVIDEIKRAGFDVKDSAEELMKFYKEIYG